MENDGDFYVEADCCLLCGIPEEIAPEIFETGETCCLVKRQPAAPDEIYRTIKAMWSSEVDCIRYQGRSAPLLERLGRAGLSAHVDNPLPHQETFSLRDSVSFGNKAGAELASANIAAATFRRDMRAKNYTVSPMLLGRRSVWVSWFANRFHRVDFHDGSDGRISARLHSRLAISGLASLVDEWLRTKDVADIRWEASGDPNSASPTPI